METGNEQGFTLVEALVIIAIIGILSALSLQALPAARSNQQLTTDTEQIRALLLDAKERALNQVRPDQCLPMADMASVNRASCSDVGIALPINTNKVIEFADTNSNNTYDSSDYVIATFTITAAPGTGSVTSLLFRSNPPSVFLYKDTKLMGPTDTAMIYLNGYGSMKRNLTVHSYGTIDVQSL